MLSVMCILVTWISFAVPLSLFCGRRGDVTTEPSRETNAIFHSIMMILFFLLLLHFLGIFLFVAAAATPFPCLYTFLSRFCLVSQAKWVHAENQQTNNWRKRKYAFGSIDECCCYQLPPRFPIPSWSILNIRYILYAIVFGGGGKQGGEIRN